MRIRQGSRHNFADLVQYMAHALLGRPWFGECGLVNNLGLSSLVGPPELWHLVCDDWQVAQEWLLKLRLDVEGDVSS